MWGTRITPLSIAVLLLCMRLSQGMRGLGLPNRELFEDASEPLVPQKAAAAAAATAPSLRNTRVLSRIGRTSKSSESTNTTGLTMAGLKEEMTDIKNKMRDTEHRHSKATIAAAATLGSLLLVAAVGAAGVFVWRRFAASQHNQRQRGRADKAQYYDADRLLGDPAGL